MAEWSDLSLLLGTPGPSPFPDQGLTGEMLPLACPLCAVQIGRDVPVSESVFGGVAQGRAGGPVSLIVDYQPFLYPRLSGSHNDRGAVWRSPCRVFPSSEKVLSNTRASSPSLSSADPSRDRVEGLRSILRRRPSTRHAVRRDHETARPIHSGLLPGQRDPP